MMVGNLGQRLLYLNIVSLTQIFLPLLKLYNHHCKIPGVAGNLPFIGLAPTVEDCNAFKKGVAYLTTTASNSPTSSSPLAGMLLAWYNPNYEQISQILFTSTGQVYHRFKFNDKSDFLPWKLIQ